MRFLFITDNPEIADYVVARGVDRIMVDLEINGKEARQGHLSTVISRHSLADVARIRDAVPPGRLLVRVNPVSEVTRAEVDSVIAAGADIVMLPMYRSIAEVETFVRAVDGRARTMLLAETGAAIAAMDAIAAIDGVDEIHIGLNDLSLDLGLGFMFRPLADGLIDAAAAAIRRTGKPFGIGGVARVDEGLLPAQFVIGEHARLGSTAAILSRTFHRNAGSVAEIEAEMDFAAEVAKLRAAHVVALQASGDELAANHREVGALVAAITGAAQAR